MCHVTPVSRLAAGAILSAAAVLGTTQPARAQPAFVDEVYGDHPRHRLDVYLPAGQGPFPVVVFIHGGGWQNGDKSSVGRKAGLLTQRGLAVASINYRLSQHATFPAQIHDCKGAIRFVRASASRYRIDPRRMGVWGSSAGGHLAALVGTSADVGGAEGTVGGNAGMPSRVQAAVDYFGPTDFFLIDDQHGACDSPESRMLGVCVEEVIRNRDDPEWADEVALMALAGGATHVTPDDPAFYIAHGTEDPVVDPEHSRRLHALLLAAGVTSALNLVEGAGHGVPQAVDAVAADFLRARLLGLCRADIDSDGVVDSDDFFDYLNFYADGNPWADINGDGRVDSDDFFDFLNAYLSGCG